jgi:hypothetical protein
VTVGAAIHNGNFPLMQQKPHCEPLNPLFRNALAGTELH